MSKFVRIHPYDPQLGHIKRRYMVFDQLFREDRGWYRDVPDYVAEYLATVRNLESDPTSALVFQIVADAAAAKALEETERKRKLVVERATPEEAHAVKVRLPGTADPRFAQGMKEAREERDRAEEQEAREKAERIARQEAELLARQEERGGTLTSADLHAGEPPAAPAGTFGGRAWEGIPDPAAPAAPVEERALRPAELLAGPGPAVGKGRGKGKRSAK